MAIAHDQDLGTGGDDTSGTTAVLTTTNAVAAGGFITVYVTWFDFSANTLSSVSGGGLTWHIDKQQLTGSMSLGIASAQAPSGLAASTAITATYSGSEFGFRYIAGDSWTGVATSSPVDGTPPAIHADSSTAWTSNNYTISNSGSLLIALAGEVQAAMTSTPTSPAVELQDFTGATSAGSSMTVAYRMPGATGSFAVAGTWSATTGTGNAGTIAVAYLPGASTAHPSLILPNRYRRNAQLRM